MQADFRIVQMHVIYKTS